jgi:hypothetical protein
MERPAASNGYHATVLVIVAIKNQEFLYPIFFFFSITIFSKYTSSTLLPSSSRLNSWYLSFMIEVKISDAIRSCEEFKSSYIPIHKLNLCHQTRAYPLILPFRVHNEPSYWQVSPIILL